MNDKQKKALSEYLARIKGHTIDPFRPTFEGWIYVQNNFWIYMGIEPDGSRHTYHFHRRGPLRN